jgi:large subunit ribosomal protein L28
MPDLCSLVLIAHFRVDQPPTPHYSLALMSRICAKTGKKTAFGNTRSHSLRSTRRTWQTNLIKKRVFDPASGEYKTIRVSAAYLRTLAKRMQQGKKA